MNGALQVIAVLLATALQSQAVEQYNKCDMDFEKVGCYNDKDSDRALPNELLNERDISNPHYDGHMLDWKDFKHYISKLACRCASKSRELGYEYFGLQFFAECWSGKGDYKKYGADEKGKCYRDATPDTQANTCVDKNNEVCVGSQLTNYVYRLIKNVDGGFSLWSKWTPCSKTCGIGLGLKHRTRQCDNPKPQGHGKDCSSLGPVEESTECGTQECIPDVDGGFSLWSEWTPCSKTCGRGVMRQIRKCNNPKPQGHGKDCSSLGLAEEVEECGAEECKPDVEYPPTTQIPVCDKRYEVGVIVDGSTSVRKANFQKVRDILKELVNNLKVSPQGTHMGIILYSTRSEIKHRLDGSQDPSTVKEVIQSIGYPEGWTFTDKALKMAATQLLTSGQGARAGVPKLVIVFTDGGNTDGITKLRNVIDTYYKNKITTVAVGIGALIKPKQLLVIAQGKQDNVISAEDFDALKNKLGDIVKQACEATDI